MVSIQVDPLSLTTHYLRMISYGSDQVMSTATGFIYEHDSCYYLITNAHNVTRINPETNQRITTTAAFPVKIQIRCRVQIEGLFGVLKDFYDVDLYSDEDYKQPLWFVHPTHNYNVDVVAIKIEEKKNVDPSIKLFPINETAFDSEYPLQVSDDVYVLGYPFDTVGPLELPIWKRGTISTEPTTNIDNLPKFLIDTATRSGMSGSPVIMKRRGIHSPHPDMNFLRGDEIIGTIRNFAGVYSGRIGSTDNFQAQLGIVWKAHVIDEIFAGRQIGGIEFQKI